MAAAAAAAAALTAPAAPAADDVTRTPGVVAAAAVLAAVAAAVAAAGDDDDAADAAADAAAIAFAVAADAADTDDHSNSDDGAAAGGAAAETMVTRPAAAAAAAAAAFKAADATSTATREAASAARAAAADATTIAAAAAVDAAAAVAAAVVPESEVRIADAAADIAASAVADAVAAIAAAAERVLSIETMLAQISVETRDAAGNMQRSAHAQMAAAKLAYEAAKLACEAAAVRKADAVARAAPAIAAKTDAAAKATAAAARARELDAAEWVAILAMNSAHSAAMAAHTEKVVKDAAANLAEAQWRSLHYVRQKLTFGCTRIPHVPGGAPWMMTAKDRLLSAGASPPAPSSRVWDNPSVATDLIAAAADKLAAERLDRLRGILGESGAASAVQLARQLAGVPDERRVEETPKRAAAEGTAVWAHRVWAALAGEVAASLGDSFTGCIGHGVRLFTHAQPRYPSIATFAHIEAGDPRDGNVVNARVKVEVKRNWEGLLAKGIAQAREYNNLTLLHMFAVHGADNMFSMDGKWSYSVASDGIYIFILRTSVELDPPKGDAFMRTRVSPPLPLWPADIMAAAYPSGCTTWPGVDEAAAAVASVDGIPAGLLALASLFAVDREFLGNRDVPLPKLAGFVTPTLDGSSGGTGTAIDPPLPPPSDWAIVGVGGFADVYRVAWNNTPCVVKAYRRPTTRMHSLWPEAAAYHKLAGVPGVPRVHGGSWSATGHLRALLLSPVGVMLHNALPGLSFLEQLAIAVHAAAAVLRVLVAARAGHGTPRRPPAQRDRAAGGHRGGKSSGGGGD